MKQSKLYLYNRLQDFIGITFNDHTVVLRISYQKIRLCPIIAIRSVTGLLKLLYWMFTVIPCESDFV